MNERRPFVLPLSILWAILAVPALVIAPFAVFAWDDPNTTDQAWWVAGPILLLPVALIVSIAGMWLFRRRTAGALVFAALPLVDVGVLVAAGFLLD